MKPGPAILRHLLGWAVCSVVAFTALWVMGYFYQGAERKLGGLEEAVLGVLLFPMGATELVSAVFNVKVTMPVVWGIVCAAWGLVIYGAFHLFRVIRRRRL